MKTQLIITAIVLLGACTEVRTQSESIQNSDLTPTSIKKAEGSIGSYSRSKSLNSVEKLFLEAVDSDAELKTLLQKNTDLKKSLRSERSEILKYLEINRDYYNTANSIANQMTNTEHKINTENQLSKAYSSYQSKFEQKEQNKADELKIMENELDDQLAMLKINISLKMISNYQKNEQHSINDIKTEYEKIVNRFQLMLKG